MALIASVASRKERRRFTRLKEIIEMHYPVSGKAPHVWWGEKSPRRDLFGIPRLRGLRCWFGPALLLLVLLPPLNGPPEVSRDRANISDHTV
jgi:hypothetical protein